MPSLGSGRAVNHPLWVCSHKICSSLVHSPGTSLDEGSSAPAPGTPPGDNDLASVLEASPGALTGLVEQSPGPEGKVAAVIGPPSPKADWRKSISEYLQLGTIPDDEIETRRLARRAKGYLIHDNKLYRRSTSGILQWCIPPGEDKALLLDIHEGIWGHHASSRSMVGKAFRQGFY
jgi:hypothetical protein